MVYTSPFIPYVHEEKCPLIVQCVYYESLGKGMTNESFFGTNVLTFRNILRCFKNIATPMATPPPLLLTVQKLNMINISV